jgi:hypothetical protein
MNFHGIPSATSALNWTMISLENEIFLKMKV